MPQAAGKDGPADYAGAEISGGGVRFQASDVSQHTRTRMKVTCTEHIRIVALVGREWRMGIN